MAARSAGDSRQGEQNSLAAAWLLISAERRIALGAQPHPQQKHEPIPPRSA